MHFLINLISFINHVINVVRHLLPKRAWETPGEPRCLKCSYESHGISGLSKVSSARMKHRILLITCFTMHKNKKIVKNCFCGYWWTAYDKVRLGQTPELLFFVLSTQRGARAYFLSIAFVWFVGDSRNSSFLSTSKGSEVVIVKTGWYNDVYIAIFESMELSLLKNPAQLILLKQVFTKVVFNIQVWNTLSSSYFFIFFSLTYLNCMSHKTKESLGEPGRAQESTEDKNTLQGLIEV